MTQEHKLVGGTLYIESDDNGQTKGVIGRCTCGYETGHRFSSFIASAAFRDHQEEMKKKEASP